MQDVTKSAEVSSPAKVCNRPSFIIRFVRFIAWICVVIGGLTLASTAYTFAPCLFGVAGACISGVLLLFGLVFALVFCGAGWLLFFFTRHRAKVKLRNDA